MGQPDSYGREASEFKLRHYLEVRLLDRAGGLHYLARLPFMRV